ncbi:MAG: imidazole glycerol phosphate synthase subunit HisH [Alphaproteobacteria bacterium]|nr:imidazole glycerol phosphate synthase subunit HisH [Alphaproteobacteria bacterium]
MAETVAIVDYGSGNLRSAAKAFERAAAGTPARIAVTADPHEVRRADRIVLPGVGAFADCMNGLMAVAGIHEALEEAVHRNARPFLGICVGMQLMAERGVEFGTHKGLGWIAGEVRAIEPKAGLKVPHMGWNDVQARPGEALFAGLAPGEPMYFVHSYALCARDAGDVAATAEYGGPITAAVRRANMAGTQFHPEKSQAAGLRLIANFLAWRP